nr:uncharacterized protein LOC127329392 [Lolium perenne]
MYPNSSRDFKAEQFRPYPLATAPLYCSDGPRAALWSDASPISYAFPQAQRRPLVSSSSLPLEAAAGRKHAATRPSILRPSALPANAAPPSPLAAAASPSRFPSTRRRRMIPTLPAAGSRASSPRGGVVTLKWYIRLGEISWLPGDCRRQGIGSRYK